MPFTTIFKKGIKSYKIVVSLYTVSLPVPPEKPFYLDDEILQTVFSNGLSPNSYQVGSCGA
jgi:hypothetical protein